VRKSLAPLLVFIFTALLSLPTLFSQNDPVDPLKSSVVDYVTWVGDYPNTGGHVVYNYSDIHVGFTVGWVTGDFYWETSYTYLYLCTGVPGTPWWSCGYWESLYLWFHVYTVEECVEDVCFDVLYLEAVLVDPSLYNSRDGWLTYNKIRVYRDDEIEVHVWIVGYTLYVDEQCGGWLEVHLNYSLEKNDETITS